MEIPIMAHYAELDSNNVVLRVVALDNSVMKNSQDVYVEQLGIDFLKLLFGAETVWKQTSYNTRAGIYYTNGTNKPATDQSQAFRKNYAGIGYVYDLTRDAFVSPKPVVLPDMEQYLTFDEFSCLWNYNPPQSEGAIGVTHV
jgi:hypothetical protein